MKAFSFNLVVADDTSKMTCVLVFGIALVMFGSNPCAATDRRGGCQWQTDDNNGHQYVDIPDCLEDHNLKMSANNFRMGTNRSKCHRPLSPQLLNCPLLQHNASNYKVQADDSFADNETGFTAIAGDFYVDPTSLTAYTCHKQIQHREDLPRCHFLSASAGDYEICNGSVHVISANVTVYRPSWWTTIDGNGSLNLCVPLNAHMFECVLWILTEPDFKIMPDGRLYYVPVPNLLTLENYAPYEYGDGNEFAVCPLNRKNVSHFPDIYYVSVVTKAISALCLVVSIVLNTILAKQNCQARALLCLLISMTFFSFSDIGRMLDTLQLNKKTACYVFFALPYYFLMATMSWFAMLSFDAMHFFTDLRYYTCPFKFSRFICYKMIAWGMPLTFLATALLVDHLKVLQHFLHLYPRIWMDCWFTDVRSRWVFVFGPLLAIITCNFVFFFFTVVALCRSSQGIKLANRNRNRQMSYVFIKLFIITSVIIRIPEIIVWIALDNNYMYLYPSRLITDFQSIGVSIVCSFRRNTYRLLRAKLCDARHPSPRSSRPVRPTPDCVSQPSEP